MGEKPFTMSRAIGLRWTPRPVAEHGRQAGDEEHGERPDPEAGQQGVNRIDSDRPPSRQDAGDLSADLPDRCDRPSAPAPPRREREPADRREE